MDKNITNSEKDKNYTNPFETRKRLSHRLTEAVLNHARINHQELNDFLRQHLSSDDITQGALLTEPVLEASASYVSSGKKLPDLSGSLLEPDLVHALTKGEASDYLLKEDFQPYKHQLESWEILSKREKQSLLVTSGTGSGKTECFLIPLLNDLAKELQEKRAQGAAQKLSGVRAIMLYPLNALIASQEERLKQWTHPFGGDLRFGLYNGNMPNELKVNDLQENYKSNPEQVFERHTLRTDPPPILVTNVTMLEYLTIRKIDQPLVQNSKGKLRWIIIDEAHSYIGSEAAEIALLIRRVLQTFQVEAKDVRFVATSATIGNSGEAGREELRKFLAGLSGVPESQIHVVEGVRAQVDLPPADPATELNSDSLRDPDKFLKHPKIQTFIRTIEKAPLSLPQVRKAFEHTDVEPLAVISALAGKNDQQKAILPFRVHNFARAIPGIRSCLNPHCSGAKPKDWPFGAIQFERVERCPICGAPVYEIVYCKDCGEPYLSVFERDSTLLAAKDSPIIDDYQNILDKEDPELEDTEANTAADADAKNSIRSGIHRLLAVRPHKDLSSISLDPKTGKISERKGVGEVFRITPIDWDESCPSCHTKPKSSRPSPFKGVRYSAPFLLNNAVSIMLDGVPPMPRTDHLLPSEGRRLLSFTDSRQGTARFAASVETNSERNFIRGFLYHLVQRKLPNQKVTRVINDAIDALVKVGAEDPESRLHGIYLEQKKKLSGDATGVAWKDASLSLTNDATFKNNIRKIWIDRRIGEQPEDLANFLILRELARRPVHANSSETLGILKLNYDCIENIQTLPHTTQRLGISLQDWKDFLYILLDNPIRNRFALNISWDDTHWLLGHTDIKHNITPPDHDPDSNNDIRWPHAGIKGRPNAVLILERALNLSRKSKEDCAVMNDILEEAWRTLSPILEAGSAYALAPNKARLCPVQKGWLCPVTRRVLTHLAFGKTPYGLNYHAPQAEQDPIPLDFPSPPLTFPKNSEDRDQLQDWLHQDEKIQQLRSLGVWGALHDSIALFSPYFRAEEHSAQQKPADLRAFEKDFRAGELNILACSTTMEMGVDIGSVSAVMMTNVPPSIANYRQRVGRAGRRGQGFSTALTLAKDTPLEKQTFQDPIKYLGMKLSVPRVKLDSRPITMRHVNALLLARWLATKANGELLEMPAGIFFGCPSELDPEIVSDAPVDAFCDWLDTSETHLVLQRSLEAVIANTALQDEASDLFEDAKQAFIVGKRDFQNAWLALAHEAATTTGAARKSIEMQLRRLCQEQLLKELANRSILPAHGFPLAIVPFVNACKSLSDSQKKDKHTKYSYNSDFPSRNCSVAIREYAPGSDIVIDGLVWRSAGVTLNWKRPAEDQNVREIQSLKYYWECSHCGASGFSNEPYQHCPDCKALLEKKPSHFLEPAGFCVDYWNEQPHANPENIAVVPAEPAKVSIRKLEWAPLFTPDIGRISSSHDGFVYFENRGTSKRGYCICLFCGRAAEEREDGSNPLEDHRPLRGGENTKGKCQGNYAPFGMLRNVALGHSMQTDVVELQSAYITDEPAAWAIASALREALSAFLGVENDEIGLSVQNKPGILEQNVPTVYLYDKAEGGAGFVTALKDNLKQILKLAEKVLDCPDACAHGCPKCILARDLYDAQDIIDRKSGLAAIRNMLGKLASPPPEDMSMPDASFSYPVADALCQEAHTGDTITIYTEEDFDLSALDKEPLVTLFKRLKSLSCKIQVILPTLALKDYSDAEKLGLRDMAARHNFMPGVWNPEKFDNQASWVAVMLSGKTFRAWSGRDPSVAVFGEDWGRGKDYPIISGTPKALPEQWLIEPSRLLPTQDIPKTEDQNSSVIQLKSYGLPYLQVFGSWFTKQIEPELQRLDCWYTGHLTKVAYSDRYLCSPLTIILAMRSMCALVQSLGKKDQSVMLSLKTRSLRQDPAHGYSDRIFHNWQQDSDREAVTKAIAQKLRLSCKIECGGDIPHARELSLTYDDGSKAILWLDQGFGAWKIRSGANFDFHLSPESQAAYLINCNSEIYAPGSTHISLMKV